jgi:hypothetical protein
MGLNHPLKKTFCKNCCFLTTGASNNLALKNDIFLEALIPLTPPALMKGASKENILSN